MQVALVPLYAARAKPFLTSGFVVATAAVYASPLRPVPEGGVASVAWVVAKRAANDIVAEVPLGGRSPSFGGGVLAQAMKVRFLQVSPVGRAPK